MTTKKKSIKSSIKLKTLHNQKMNRGKITKVLLQNKTYTSTIGNTEKKTTG